ncbi:MAG: hypothetical protein ACK4XK_04045 [Casimicrobiaceae bacterium]
MKRRQQAMAILAKTARNAAYYRYDAFQMITHKHPALCNLSLATRDSPQRQHSTGNHRSVTGAAA